jgi:acetylglutamate kinase
VLLGEQLIPSLAAREAESLIRSQVIKGGMIPKVRAALGAIAGGAKAARITDLDGLMNGSGTIFTKQ